MVVMVIINGKPKLRASCLFFMQCCSKESLTLQCFAMGSELSVKCAFPRLLSLVCIAQEVNKPWRCLFGFCECFFQEGACT